MTDLLQPISVSTPGGEPLRFARGEDIERWLDAEAPLWATINTKGLNLELSRIITNHSRFFAKQRRNLDEYLKCLAADPPPSGEDRDNKTKLLYQQIVTAFDQVSKGLIITSSHPYYPFIRQFAPDSSLLCATLVAAARSDKYQLLGEFSQLQIPNAVLVDLLLATRQENTSDWLGPKRAELDNLKSEALELVARLATTLTEREKQTLTQESEAKALMDAREQSWSKLKESINDDWRTLKAVYDEKLALLAPTQYWSARAEAHKKVATAFAVTFGVLLLGIVGAFFVFGGPHLSKLSTQETVPTILVLIPLAIPAFAGVWVLRMMSRLLSENLQMMRDARERETMVMTFLALMREDSAGKALVKDEDRIMILHSLFRPSSISSIDDSPPVHWFDILTNRTTARPK